MDDTEKGVIVMSGASKKEYLEKIRWRYRHSGKGGKGRILDEFCAVCDYERKYAIKLLGQKRVRVLKRPGPKPKYGPQVFAVLKAIWLACDQMCSTRLKAALRLWLPYLRAEPWGFGKRFAREVVAIEPGNHRSIAQACEG